MGLTGHIHGKGGSHTKNRFFTAFLKKSRTGCVKMGLAHEKKSYLQEKANLFEIGSNTQGYSGKFSSSVK